MEKNDKGPIEMEKTLKAVTTDEPENNYKGWKSMPFIIGNETFEKLGANWHLSQPLDLSYYCLQHEEYYSCKYYQYLQCCNQEAPSTPLCIRREHMQRANSKANDIFAYWSNVSWAIGLGIPAILMLISCAIFFLGSKMYVKVKATGSPMTSVVRVIVVAIKKRRLKLPEQPWLSLFNHLSPSSINSKLSYTDQFRFLDKAATVTPQDQINPDGSAANPWKLCTMQQVEEVKCLLRVMPIWASAVIYLYCYSPTEYLCNLPSPSIQQTPWKPQFQDPSCILYSQEKKAASQSSRELAFGIFISVLTMLVSALVEERRRTIALTEPTLGVVPRKGAISSMSGLWLIPQLTLAGLAEGFASIGLVEFYYKQFPENMRSIAGSLFFCGHAGSSYLSSFLISIVHRTTKGAATGNWLPEDLNKGRLDYFYYTITALGVLNFGYFLVCAKWYKYKGTGKDTLEDNLGSTQPQKIAI
uniref:Uncharacterized protein n=1 Tax=Fagus sylvatica TaxID=28930 RepID=A0A2N9H3K4_FAGSY